MDIGLREWLIVIGIIVIAGILFDGWRRMRPHHDTGPRGGPGQRPACNGRARLLYNPSVASNRQAVSRPIERSRRMWAGASGCAR